MNEFNAQKRGENSLKSLDLFYLKSSFLKMKNTLELIK